MIRSAAWKTVMLVVALASPAAAQFRAVTIVRGLDDPVAVVSDPTDASLLLIVEQRGVIRVAQQGTLVAEPFLDLRNDVRAGGERGLLGMALAPDFAQSRRFFVNFTNRDGDTVVARFCPRCRESAARRPGLALRSGLARRTALRRSSRSPTTTAGTCCSARTAISMSGSATAAAAATR